ncbi:MAG TPA: hypothetical protein VGA20_06105 [Gemmatimonadales bacterium]
MHATDLERRDLPDRRALPDRRSETDRRTATGTASQDSAPERRVREDRRKSDRRLGVERRLALQSIGDQIRAALGLLTRLVDAGRVDDDGRRYVDAALLRLKFALDRLGQP